MSDLGIYFSEDVTSRLLALHQANERALTLAQRYGMDAEAAGLCWQVYSGALSDVARAFGLTALTIPTRKEVISDGELHRPGEPVASNASGPAFPSHGEFVATVANEVTSGHPGPGVGAGAKPGQKRGDPRAIHP